MILRFGIEGRPVEFRWSNWTGEATLHIDGVVLQLQSALDPSSHFSASTIRQWRYVLYGHNVEITKRRPVFFAAFRPNDFTVTVDGVVVATGRGT